MLNLKNEEALQEYRNNGWMISVPKEVNDLYCGKDMGGKYCITFSPAATIPGYSDKDGEYVMDYAPFNFLSEGIFASEAVEVKFDASAPEETWISIAIQSVIIPTFVGTGKPISFREHHKWLDRKGHPSSVIGVVFDREDGMGRQELVFLVQINMTKQEFDSLSAGNEPVVAPIIINRLLVMLEDVNLGRELMLMSIATGEALFEPLIDQKIFIADGREEVKG